MKKYSVSKITLLFLFGIITTWLASDSKSSIKGFSIPFGWRGMTSLHKAGVPFAWKAYCPNTHMITGCTGAFNLIALLLDVVFYILILLILIKWIKFVKQYFSIKH
jgi:hypothetical protein